MNFRILSSLALLALCGATANAAIVYSGERNIPISSTFTSSFLDVDAMSSLPSASAGWDIEAFFGGEAFGNSAAFQPARVSVGADTAILRLELGTLVDVSLNYFNDAAGSSTHMGNGAGQFVSGSEGYFGFRFTENDSDGPYYGWMRVVFSNNGGTGTIVDWAYDNGGGPIAVGVIPEPSAVMLGGLGALALVFRRRGTRASTNG